MPAFVSRACRALTLLCMAGLAASPLSAQDEGLFDRLFGTDPAAERAGKAADGLALPGLVAEGRLIADTIALHDLGAQGGARVAILPLVEALELAHEAGPEGVAVTLPDPRRTITIPAAALLPSPSGDCLPLADLPDHLPLSLAHDHVGQRLVLTATAALPVLMRLAREER